MTLVEGEYEFTCTECHGDGQVPTVRGDDEVEQGWGACDDCHGAGTVTVDHDEAAEFLEEGHTPIRTPAAG